MSSYPVLSYEDAVMNCRDLFNVTIGEEGLRRPTVSQNHYIAWQFLSACRRFRIMTYLLVGLFTSVLTVLCAIPCVEDLVFS